MVQPKNEGYLGNNLIKRAGIDTQYTEKEMQEYLKCSENPCYFIQKYTQILKNLLIRRDGSIQNENIENYLLVLKAKDPNTTPEELDKLSNNNKIENAENKNFRFIIWIFF